MRRRWWALAVVVVLAAGCGVPTDEDATVHDDVPFGLLDRTTTTQTSAPSQGRIVTQVFFLTPTRERLVPVDRRLDEGTAEEALEALLDGPTEAETRIGLRTALQDEAVVRSTEVTGGVATVDLHSDFDALPGSTEVLALAQIVYTATARPGVGRVTFLLEGAPVEVPRGDGSLTSGSVSRDTYDVLAPSG